MESLLLNDPSLPQSKQTKKSKKKPISNNNHHHHYHGMTRMPNISRHKSCSAIHQNYAPSPQLQLEMVQSALGDGMFLNHCRKQYSLPPILPTYYQPHHYHHHQQQPQPQPPLLPLPFVSNPTFRSLPTSTTPRKKSNKPKATTTTTTTKEIRKPLPPQKLKKENKKSDDDQVVEGARKGIIEPTPVRDPKESETQVLADTDPNNNNNNNNNNSEVVTKDEIPPLVLSLLASPPPSSLPLPKFTVKRQNKSSSLSCNAEAAADKVATDNLCRLLKLR